MLVSPVLEEGGRKRGREEEKKEGMLSSRGSSVSSSSSSSPLHIPYLPSPAHNDPPSLPPSLPPTLPDSNSPCLHPLLPLRFILPIFRLKLVPADGTSAMLLEPAHDAGPEGGREGGREGGTTVRTRKNGK